MDANTPQPPAGDGNWMALLDALPEEQKKAWLGLANVQQQQGDLDEQMKRAEALRKPGAAPYGLAAGLLSGGAQVLNAYTSKRDAAKVDAERKKLYDQVTRTRVDVVGTLARQQAQAEALRHQQAAQQAAPGPFSSAPQPVQGQQDFSKADAYPFLFGGQ